MLSGFRFVPRFLSSVPRFPLVCTVPLSHRLAVRAQHPVCLTNDLVDRSSSSSLLTFSCTLDIFVHCRAALLSRLTGQDCCLFDTADGALKVRSTCLLLSSGLLRCFAVACRCLPPSISVHELGFAFADRCFPYSMAQHGSLSDDFGFGLVLDCCLFFLLYVLRSSCCLSFADRSVRTGPIAVRRLIWFD